MVDGWKIAQFLLDNWMSIVSFVGFVTMWFTTKDQKEKQQAQNAVLAMAIDAVKLAAEQTLENKEKREWAINTVKEAMPEKYKKYIDEQALSALVEQAWLTIVKPTLK